MEILCRHMVISADPKGSCSPRVDRICLVRLRDFDPFKGSECTGREKRGQGLRQGTEIKKAVGVGLEC